MIFIEFNQLKTRMTTFKVLILFYCFADAIKTGGILSKLTVTASENNKIFKNRPNVYIYRKSLNKK